MALCNYQSGSFSNVTLCPISTGLPVTAVSGTATNTGAILTIRYHIVAGVGVSAGNATFQELGCDGQWRSMQDVTAITLTAGDFSGVINGPVHGVRISLGAITGGTVSFAELIGATLT